MTQIISITNQKGGVGKTTTALNLSAALALKNHRTLLIDLDPQGSATSGLGFTAIDKGIYSTLMGQCTAQEVIHSTMISNLDLIPSNEHLAGAELELVNESNRVFFLKKVLTTIKDYEFIIIDTSPSLGILTLNALSVSAVFIVPLQCEYYALEGLSRLLETAREVKERWNIALKLQGILLTLFDSRNSLSHQVEKEVRRHFKNQVFKTIIPRNVRLSEAPSFGKTIFQYESGCLGAIAYEQLAGEILQKYSDQKKAIAPLAIKKESV